MEINTIAIISISLFGIAILIESLISYKHKLNLYDLKDSLNSISLGIIGVITRVLIKSFTLLLWYYFYDIAIFKFTYTWYYFIALFLFNDFIYYWFHRISHEIRFFWATHVNHHSSEKMNFATATRVPFLNALYHCFFWIPLPFLGFNPSHILLVEVSTFFIAFFQHTQLIPKLGWIEWFLNTPSHHRVHHANNEKYLNKNYGNVLIIFDRLFGTFEEEKEKPTYGLTTQLKSNSLLYIIFHEWIALVKQLFQVVKNRKIPL
ncbi:MAG: sterol desaturase family protein [Cyclobacteriaceae bacterium]|nr:sterol desaturase family protein [Cyclobacteriaceae bacterium]